MSTSTRRIKVPRGLERTCQGWQQEGILRLLLNTLDEDVAHRPDDLIAYGTGKVVRNWEALEATVTALQRLRGDETLVMQSGRPVGVFPTHPSASRVVMANAMLVPAWSDDQHFRALEAKGLTMYGQTSAGSWSFIGAQGVVQAALVTFAQVAQRHFGGSLAGRWVLTSGLGGLGRAQPIAIRAVGGVALVVEGDGSVVSQSVKDNYCDIATRDLDEALKLVREAVRQRTPRAIALVGNAAEIYPEIARRGVTPDIVTDQTAAHDLLNGYLPVGLDPVAAGSLRSANPQEYLTRAEASLVEHFRAIQAMAALGAVAFDHGNNIRGQAHRLGVTDAFTLPGHVEAYIRPLFCEGRGSFRWVALSGEPEDIFKIDALVLSQFAADRWTADWIRLAQQDIWFQGLPARACWFGPTERAELALRINQMVRTGELQGPVAITRDHQDSGAVASPYRETENMQDGSDAVADWPVLNALLAGASGAHMVSLNHGGGVGIGYSIHAGLTMIADGDPAEEERLSRVLFNDPLLGILRHADAGYDQAHESLARTGLVPPKGGSRLGE